MKISARPEHALGGWPLLGVLVRPNQSFVRVGGVSPAMTAFGSLATPVAVD